MILCSKIKCQGAAAKQEEAEAATLRVFALHLVLLIKRCHAFLLGMLNYKTNIFPF